LEIWIDSGLRDVIPAQAELQGRLHVLRLLTSPGKGNMGPSVRWDDGADAA
jgi:hypothetical protein